MADSALSGRPSPPGRHERPDGGDEEPEEEERHDAPEDDGGGILYSAERDSLEVLNPVAAEIWKFLSAPRTRAEVAAHLCETCAGAERGQVANDVAEFLESLLKKGFIGVVEDPA